MPKILSFCNFYLFLQEALYVQIPGALDYWYTADNKCVPGGPHFDLTYYLTYTQLIGAIAGFIGIIVFQTVMTNWTYRSSFLVSTFIRIIASMFDVIIISRINIKWGIHDKVAYLFGDALIITTASMLANMPAVLLTTKICPKGYESTTYALLAGFQNFGANVSKAIGISLMGFFNINLSSKAKCTFDNLSLLVFICHFILPLITIPLTWVFIPNARVDSEITTGIEFIRSDIGSGNDISASIELNEKDQLRLRRSSHDKIISPSTKLE